MTPKLDLDEVRAALTTRTVVEYYGWRVRRSGDQLESSSCPDRSDHSRRAFVINARNGRWQCFPCDTSGDLFTFIALVERLEIGRDFPAVLAKAAELAGVGPSALSEDERRHRRAVWQARRDEDEARERAEKAARDAAAVPLATAYWNSLPTKNAQGFDYLCERGVADAILFPDAIRFDPEHGGSPSIKLHSSIGEIRNVVARRLPTLGEPKTRGLPSCPTPGTFVNAVSEIQTGRDVVLTEGVMDSITARILWRDATILGAHAGGNLPVIARVAAPAVVRANARMFIVPHQDKAGFARAVEAGRLAVEAGLSVERQSLCILRHPEKDLNDAWRFGWRPAA